LEKANIRTVGGLARKREDDLLEVEGLGPKRYRKLSARSAALASFLNK